MRGRIRMPVAIVISRPRARNLSLYVTENAGSLALIEMTEAGFVQHDRVSNRF
jgi:hypothetical protein